MFHDQAQDLIDNITRQHERRGGPGFGKRELGTAELHTDGSIIGQRPFGGPPPFQAGPGGFGPPRPGFGAPMGGAAPFAAGSAPSFVPQAVPSMPGPGSMPQQGGFGGLPPQQQNFGGMPQQPNGFMPMQNAFSAPPQMNGGQMSPSTAQNGFGAGTPPASMAPPGQGVGMQINPARAALLGMR